ncbi:hypothetical protein TorRG33x02_354060, partial [Trema orientale]
MAGEDHVVVDVDPTLTLQEQETEAVKTGQHGQANSSHDHQATDSTNEGLSVKDTDLLCFLQEQNDEKNGAVGPNDSVHRRKIRPVPEVLRKNFETHYNPGVIAIGPIHHHHNSLMKKEFKGKLAARFFKASDQPGPTLLKTIKNKIEDLKKGFDDEVIRTYDDETLARMLFLDGCSMLQFIHCYVGNELKEFDISNGQAKL